MKQMKNSNIEWIGEIPEDWKVERISAIYTLRNEKVSDKDYPPLSVTMKGILPQLETAAKTNDGDNRKLVLKGDFAINSRSDRRGSCGISSYDGSVSLINIVLSPKKTMNAHFYNWLFHTVQFSDEFYKWGHGIVADLWTTDWQNMSRISIVAPPLPEQQKIAEFLDKKCEEIDGLIKAEEGLIEKLKEYKQSVITEAVTKGIRPARAMKNSGVEWIGEIPEDWTICKIKNAYISRNEKYSGGDFPYIALENVESMSGRYIETVTNQLYDLNSSLVAYKSDVIYGKLRPYLAKSLIVKRTSCLSCEFAVFYSTVNITKWLHYIFLSSFFTELVNSSTYGAKMPRANLDFIKTIEIPLPNTTEQQEIVAYLDGKCAETDRLIALKQEKIEKLKEYKQSVIYEYVTGKKEV